MINFKKGFKKRKGSLLVDVAIAMIVIMILIIGGLVGYQEIKDNANRTAANQELQTLKSAMVSYIGLSKSSSAPSDLGGLITGLTAANSIDNSAHVNFVQKDGWTSSASSFVDPWGNTYTLSTTNRTISSTAGGSTAISVSY